MSTAYCAYPIDQAATHQWFAQYVDFVMAEIRDNSPINVTFDPGDAFRLAPQAKPTGYIAEINEHAADAADAVVAFLPKGVPSIGVPMEIDRAVQAGKVVAVVTDVQSWMLQYNRPNVRVFTPTSWLGDGSTQMITDLIDFLSDQLPERQALPTSDLLPVKFTAENALLPTRGHADDAGLDLYVSQAVTIPPGKAVDVPCAVAVELPGWSWGLLVGRSSARRTHGLLIHTGIIDAGYRGELFALAENTTDKPVTVEPGMRLAQLIVMANMTKQFTPVQVERLNDSERGTGGFGSTGR